MSVAQGGECLKGEKIYPRSIYNRNLICCNRLLLKHFYVKQKDIQEVNI